MAANAGTTRRALTAVEEALYMSALLEPAARSYHRASGFRLTGPLSGECVRAALEHVALRYAALRTTFHRERGTLWAETSAASIIDLEIVEPAEEIDWIPPTLHESLRRISKPFDLSRQVFRFSLALRNGAAVLVVQAHHIGMDAFSEQLLAVALVNALAGRMLVAQVRAPQRVHRKLDASLERLCKTLDGAPAVLSLRAASERPQVRGERSLRVEVSPTPETVGAFAAGERVTPFAVLLAAWTQALATLGECDDVVVGVPFSIREPHQDSDVGCFVNMVPVRVVVDRTASFRHRVAAVRTAMMIAYSAARVPFARVCAALRPRRALDHHPIFQTAFTLRPRPIWPIAIDEITLERLSIDIEAFIYDWRLDLEPAHGRYAGFVECAADITPPSLASALSATFTDALRSGLTNPDERPHCHFATRREAS
jgi:hypothetical protein